MVVIKGVRYVKKRNCLLGCSDCAGGTSDDLCHELGDACIDGGFVWEKGPATTLLGKLIEHIKHVKG